MSSIFKSSTALTIALVLSACGGGSGSDSAGDGIGNTPATASITASPMTLMVEDSTTITWSSTGASSCTASGAWSGDKPLSGSESIVMNENGEHGFILTCGSASANVLVTVNSDNSEGSCVNPHSAEIYESYLGDYEIPMPLSSFSDENYKGVGLKDYGVEWIYNNYKGRGASWIQDCPQEEYTKLMYRTTLQRLKNHGVNTVSIYNFGYWQDAEADAWLLAQNTKHLDDWVIEYIVKEGKN